MTLGKAGGDNLQLMIDSQPHPCKLQGQNAKQERIRITDRWVCASCKVKLANDGEVGYDGPVFNGKPDPQNEDCSPLLDWRVLCKPCAEKFDVIPDDGKLKA